MEDEIYRQFILDLYKNPLNKKKLEDFDVEEKGLNPSCGDEIIVQIKFSENGNIKDIGYQGDGCAISQASASLITDEIKGKKIEEILKFTEKEIFDLLGKEIIYTRKKCAMLSLDTIKKALKYEKS